MNQCQYPKIYPLGIQKSQNRYTFSPREDWKSEGIEPQAGQEVDFLRQDDGSAREIYLLNDVETMPSLDTVFHKGNMPRWVYGLYAASLIIGITAMIGVVIAYIYRDEGNSFEKKHYHWQIRTFWNAVIGFAISFILIFVGIGLLLFWFVYVWYIYRIIWGWIKYETQKTV